ncbi:MAG: Nramp family divalent metal transporter [Janthinobacterium lividum]|uniref:Nramp family divalent metal transporter n=1 Tax=unclassified Brevundimonas TaxID=2622653 RepID=UPI0025B7FA2A|nr:MULTISPECIES: Nramp family divalent metal transporter [unclassified Brevundimonas]
MSDLQPDKSAVIDGGDDHIPKNKWSLIGPGIVVAATGVGAGDLVATLIAGSKFGYALLWAAIVGTILKIALAEATGRYTLAGEKTIFEGWSSLGKGFFGSRINWAGLYFGIYVVIWGFVYGAAAMTSTALPMAALFPVLDLKTWGMLAGIAGLIFVWFGGYGLFEKVMTFAVGVMFVTVIGLAIIVAPNIPNLLTGLWPTLPQGSVFYTLGLIGGVGGTITMAAYGYWLNAKGWHGPSWIKVMRLDNQVGYIVTGVFVIAMLIVGAELLYSAGIALQGGDRGLLDLSGVLRDRFSPFVATMFLVGFWATSFSSLLGVWNGVSLMFSDFITHVRGKEKVSMAVTQKTWSFRFFALWLTFPPMALLFMDRPFGLIVAYGVLGSLFMPFLAGTLLWLLNSDRVPKEWRSGWLSNLMLTAATILFASLAINEISAQIGKLFQ